MTSPLLGTTVSLWFMAKELESETPVAAEQRSQVEREGPLVADLVARFKTRLEQAADSARDLRRPPRCSVVDRRLFRFDKFGHAYLGCALKH
jgi:hypothetical protein